MKKIYTLITAVFLWPALMYAQNAEVCDDAVVIDAGSHDVDTLTGAGGSQGYEAAWYSYTPAESGSINVNSCYGGSDTRVYIHDGDCSALNLITNNDDSCPFEPDSSGFSYASSVEGVSVVAGTEYFIEWDGRWSTDPFTFNVEFIPLPGPDSCDIALVVEPGQYYTDTLQGDAGTQDYASAWYEYTPMADGFIDVTSCYGGTDTRLYIWEGACDALTAVDDTDDDCPFAPDSSGFSYAAALYGVPVVGGTTYYIEWNGRWSNNPFFWNLAFAAPLEACSTAEEVFAPSTITIDTLTGDGGTEGYAAAWYHYTPAEDGAVTVASCYGGADTRLFVFEGDCDNLVPVGNADDDCPFAPDSTGFSYASSLDFNVTAGTTYYIEWDARWTASGFDWYIEFNNVQIEFPVNDTCGGAQITQVEVGTLATAFGDGTNATADPGFPVPEVWEAFEITECADVQIDFCGSVPMAVTLYINLFDACPIGASLPTGEVTFIECAGNDSAQSIFFPGLEAGTYWYPVLADSVNYGGFTDYTINYTATACGAQSDTCDTFLGGPWTDFNGTFGGAPVADADGNCPFNEITAFEVWASESYTVDGFVTGETYTFSICNGAYGAWEAELSVWDDQGNIVAFVQNECSISWTATYDGTYIIGINEVGACGADSDNTATDNGFPALTCEGTNSVNEIEQANFSVYPNPNNGQFSIVNEGVNGTYLIEMMDVTGKVVYSEQLQLNANDIAEINADDVTTGVYLVKMTNTEENYYRTIRMVIK